MAADIPTFEPTEHQAGTTLKFDRAFPDFPSDTWTLSYSLVSSTEAPISFTAAANGNDHRVNVAYTTTANWTPGDYLMTGFVSTATERYQVFQQPVTIKPDPAAEQTLEWKSKARRMVETLETVELQNAGSAVVSYSINGRTFTRQPWQEFVTHLGYWRGQLALEENKGKTRRVLIRRISPR